MARGGSNGAGSSRNGPSEDATVMIGVMREMMAAQQQQMILQQQQLTAQQQQIAQQQRQLEV